MDVCILSKHLHVCGFINDAGLSGTRVSAQGTEQGDLNKSKKYCKSMLMDGLRRICVQRKHL